MAARTRLALLALTLLTLAPGVAWAVLQPNAVRAHLVALDGLAEPSPGLFVGPDLDPAAVSALERDAALGPEELPRFLTSQRLREFESQYLRRQSQEQAQDQP